MSETAIEEKVEVSAPLADPFSSNSWTETPIDTIKEEAKGVATNEPAIEKKEEPIVEVKETPAAEVKKEEPIIEVKKEEPKIEPKAEIKLNPLVERLLANASDDDVFTYLQTKKELSNIEGLSAAEVLKLQIKHTNKDFNSQDIADVFEEKYSIPEKPVKDEFEEDEAYAAKLSKWEEAKAKVDRRIERDARTAKADLAKFKDELAYPKAPETEQSSQQKELEAHTQRLREQFVRALDTDYKNFKGFDTKVVYKNGEVDVEMPLSYALNEADQVALKQQLENFDPTEFLGERWFDKGGKPNIKQQMADLTQLLYGEKIHQKFANDAAAKRLEAFINEQKNIKVNGGGSGGVLVTNNAKNEVAEMGDFFLSQH